jgi:hypothetical protein
MSDIVWNSFKVVATDVEWEPASYNVKWEDGRDYGRWRRVLRKHSHGLTVISRYTAPPGKAWKIVGKAPKLGEEVYILEGPTTMLRGGSSPGQEHSCSTPPARSTAAFPAT